MPSVPILILSRPDSLTTQHLVVRPLCSCHKSCCRTPIYFGMINRICILFYYQGLIGNHFSCQSVVIDKQSMCSWSDKVRSDYVCTLMCPVKAGSVSLTHRRRLASGSRPTDRLVAETFQLQVSEWHPEFIFVLISVAGWAGTTSQTSLERLKSFTLAVYLTSVLYFLDVGNN
jgi:hypothetical protein